MKTQHLPYPECFSLKKQNIWYPTTDFQTSGTNTLYHTNDGGQSWTSFPNPQPSLYLAMMSIIDQQFAVVHMTNYNTKEDHLFLVGADGQNWQEIPLPVPGPFNSLQLHFLSQQVGWVIVTPVTFPASQDLYMTRDGGQSWTKQELSIPHGVPHSSFIQIQPLGFANALLGFLQVTFLEKHT